MDNVSGMQATTKKGKGRAAPSLSSHSSSEDAASSLDGDGFGEGHDQRRPARRRSNRRRRSSPGGYGEDDILVYNGTAPVQPGTDTGPSLSSRSSAITPDPPLKPAAIAESPVAHTHARANSELLGLDHLPRRQPGIGPDAAAAVPRTSASASTAPTSSCDDNLQHARQQHTTAAEDRLHLSGADTTSPQHAQSTLQQEPTLATSGDLAAPAAGPDAATARDPQPPRLRRQLSMPVAAQRRTRASSLSPGNRRRLAPSPGPSAGQLDPDHHWLSEDEATGSTSGGLNRQGRRRTSGRRRGTRGGHDDDNSDQDDQEPHLAIGKDRAADLATFGSTTHHLHPIHHRPSTLLVDKDRDDTAQATLMEPPLSFLLPLVVPFLTCHACNGLFANPTTLTCGHSVCLPCSMPVVHRATDLMPLRVATAGVVAPHHSESQFARNPSMPMPPPTSAASTTEMARTPSAGSRVSSFLQRTRSTSSDAQLSSAAADSTSYADDRVLAPLGRSPLLRGRAKCPRSDCEHRPTSSSAPVVDAHVDYALQKVMDLLRDAIPNLDREVERAYAAFDEDVESALGEGDGHGKALEITRSGSSGSSAGEDQLDQDESKRSHKTKAWTSSKRMRSAPAPMHDHQQQQVPEPCYVGRLQIDYDALPPTLLGDLQAELECQICVQILHNPVTSSCGHTFCQSCLARAYDHSDKCPLCRADFPSFVHLQQQKVNTTLVEVIRTLFPTQHQERLAQFQLEANDHAFVPLFVCTLSWPGLPTFIHVFEPRYRLMIRRALDSDRQFGMVLPGRVAGEIHEYGTMLYIRNCNLIEDGRSVIECVGVHRFKVLERGSLDGYTTGRIERIDDISPEQERELERRVLQGNFESMGVDQATATAPDGTTSATAPPEMSTDQLMGICHHFVSTLRSGSAPWVIQRLNNTIGPMPDNPAEFSFWMAEVMPVDEHVKAAMLPITSPRERLRLIVFWIEQFRSSWWFNRGCTVM